MCAWEGEDSAGVGGWVVSENGGAVGLWEGEFCD